MPMAFSPGQRIGPFEVIGWVGSGGMGDVLRARDARLRRDVAIKVIAERYASDANRVRRFEQEAYAAGQLNHPNVLAVHDVGVHEGAPYIVCELLEGESLRARLNNGALPAARAIDYARQIAQGLAAAHDKAVVHRDLKPDNVFVTRDGRIKILDFGVAKLTQPNDEAATAVAATEIGTIVGTVDYMSPEQVRGEPVDARSDVFSLGIILHEMLTGHAPFARGSAAERMASILKDDPVAALPPTLSPPITRVVARCLEKSRESRFQSARDLAFALEMLPQGDVAGTRVTRSRWPARTALPWLVAAAGVGLAVASSTGRRRDLSPPPTPVRLSVDLGAEAPFGALAAQFGGAVAISPDGGTLAFVAQGLGKDLPQLYVRRLDEQKATALAGTDDGNAPFFSPDGAWIGFSAGLDIRKVSVSGGAPMTVMPISSFRGASWLEDGGLVVSPGQTSGVTLERLPAAGGKPQTVTKLTEGETIHAWPQVLPGDKAVLYTSSNVTGAFNDANLVVQPLPDGPPTIVQRGGYHGQYVRSGHIVYVHDGALFALPFDAARLKTLGPSVRVIEGLAANAITGGAPVSISNTGTLVYLAGTGVGGGAPLDLVDRQGLATPLRTTPSNWSSPAYSPDGTGIALEIRDGPVGAGDIWIHRLGDETLVRATSDPALENRPVWTPDGGRITYGSNRDGGKVVNLYWQATDGSRPAQRLTNSPNEQQPGSWHPSGKFLAFSELTQDRMRDVMILPMAGDETTGWTPGAPKVFVSTPQMDWEPRFSPDGQWLAYASTVSGRWEVYVRPFPGPGAEVKVSSGGGELPTWSRARRELIYGLDGQLMIVPYTTERGRFIPGTPHAWPVARYQTRGRARMFDLSPDGSHVVLALAADGAGGGIATAQFVLNFFEELRRRAPASTP